MKKNYYDELLLELVKIFEKAVAKNFTNVRNDEEIEEVIANITEFLATEINEREFEWEKEKIWGCCVKAISLLDVNFESSKENVVKQFENNLAGKLYHKFLYRPASIFDNSQSSVQQTESIKNNFQFK